jgi:hypothetical protein
MLRLQYSLAAALLGSLFEHPASIFSSAYSVRFYRCIVHKLSFSAACYVTFSPALGGTSVEAARRPVLALQYSRNPAGRF